MKISCLSRLYTYGGAIPTKTGYESIFNGAAVTHKQVLIAWKLSTLPMFVQSGRSRAWGYWRSCGHNWPIEYVHGVLKSWSTFSKRDTTQGTGISVYKIFSSCLIWLPKLWSYCCPNKDYPASMIYKTDFGHLQLLVCPSQGNVGNGSHLKACPFRRTVLVATWSLASCESWIELSYKSYSGGSSQTLGTPHTLSNLVRWGSWFIWYCVLQFSTLVLLHRELSFYVAK